jgi:hypothetical protein
MLLRVATVAGVITALGGAGLAHGTTSATHRQWVANANRACGWAGAQRLKLGPNDGTAARWLVVLPKLRAIQIGEVRRMRTVSPPPADRMLVTDLIGNYWTKDIAEERRAYLLLEAGNVTAFKRSLARVYWYEQQEDVLLRALGTKCRQI